MSCNFQPLFVGRIGRFPLRGLIQVWSMRGQSISLCLCLSLCCVQVCAERAVPPPSAALPASATAAQAYIFDPALFRGSSINQEALLHLSQGQSATAGEYKVDIYVNQQFFEQHAVRFIQRSAQQIEPCFYAEQLQRAAILIREQPTAQAAEKITPQSAANPDPKKASSLAGEQACKTLPDWIGAGDARFDVSRLRLDLSIPNRLIKQKPSGYIDPQLWQSGESIGFINYIGHYYHSAYRFSDQSLQQNMAYLALQSGINLGHWQFRQQSTLNYQQQHSRWQNMGMLLRRPLPSIHSELSLGQLNSRGQFFSGLSFQGLQLSADDRMLPASLRGYAPVIQGIAKTPAQVTVYQNQREIYQLHVAPGAFRISDLYPTSASGDLKVVLLEADGTRSSFNVPFSAVPESVRLGAFKYYLDMGQTRGLAEDAWFATLTSQYGLSNRITLNSGIRLSEHYQSAMLGSAYTHRIGAFATDVIFSRATQAQQFTAFAPLAPSHSPSPQHQQGWLISSSYSKSIPATRTTFSMSGYRYSTAGYRELADYLGQRQALRRGDRAIANQQQERSRLAVSMQQMLGGYGNLYVSSSARFFRDQHPTDYQLQFGYSKALRNGISIQLNINRSMRHGEETRAETPLSHTVPSSNLSSSAAEQHDTQQRPAVQIQRMIDTRIGLSVNIPLGSNRSKQHNLMLIATQQDQGSQYQSSLNGSLDQDGNLSYSLGLSDERGHAKRNGYAMLQNRLQYANLGVSASRGEHYWQGSGHIQGAVALHSGGITLGHYLADTFALIEAKGAQGAQVMNTQSTLINRKGFALLSSLTPYQYNAISLNPTGMSGQTELSNGYAQVVPYAGAALKINFKTQQGHALLIRARLANGELLPMGAEVFDQAGQTLGMVAQNGQIYLRSETLEGQLQIRWGDREQESCRLSYAITPAQRIERLIKLSASCELGHDMKDIQDK